MNEPNQPLRRCPSDDQLAALIDGSLSDEERGSLTSHLDGCTRCREVIAAAAGSDGRSAGAPLGLRAGERVGRFQVIALLGIGGMGSVYSAYDPELDRKVALKIVRPDRVGPKMHVRLLREAQALARLSHPEVITIYETGAFGSSLFIAMELVTGPTLRGWLADGSHDWRAVVARFIRAGEGLAAAHAAGLVHRDFKPENVLVGDDGRQRVTDFGLARASDSPDSDGDAASTETSASTPASGSQLGEALTETGALLGTPAYMAPEQRLGGRVDARSDQYSFCVSLYQALSGQLPSLADGKGRAPLTARGRVPTRLREALKRGLEIDPERRYPTMTALLTILRKATRRTLLPVVAAAALVLLGTGAVSSQLYSRRTVCRDAGGGFARTWNAARRAQLNAVLTRGGQPYAGSIAATVDSLLDDYAARWSAMRRDACEETQVRHAQPESVLALRNACLDQRQQAAEATIAYLATADAKLMMQAPQLVSSLATLHECGDTQALLARLPPPKDQAQAEHVRAVRARIDKVAVMQNASHTGETLPIIETILQEARATGYAPIIAVASLRLGFAYVSVGRYKEAEAMLQESAEWAVRGHDDDTAERAWLSLCELVGVRQHRAQDGEVWRRYAAAAEERRGSPNDDTTGPLLVCEQDLSQIEGKLDEALTYARRNQAVRAGLHNELEAAEGDDNIAIILSLQGRVAESDPVFARVINVHERLLGRDHPSTTTSRENAGYALLMEHRFADALPLLQAGLRERLSSLGEKDSDTAQAEASLGQALGGLGRVAEAEAMNTRALNTYAALTGWDSPDLIDPLTFAGRYALQRGAAVEALTSLEKALVLAKKAAGTPLDSAEINLLLAQALRKAHRDEPRARQLATAARDAWNEAVHKFGGVNIYAQRAQAAQDWLDGR